MAFPEGESPVGRLTVACLANSVESIAPRWGAADAEIIVPSDDYTELKGSPFED